MNGNDDLAARAKAEISAMAKQGMDHPSTKPVLIGAGVGAVAGALLPVVSLPLGLAVGAGWAFWQRIKK
ncbi:MAG: hypothetical protein IH997_04895 [Proteobacteria bacterium]|nr:hypothetical protein [Pseudomonadota bacterium]